LWTTSSKSCSQLISKFWSRSLELGSTLNQKVMGASASNLAICAARDSCLFSFFVFFRGAVAGGSAETALGLGLSQRC
jgi:hypothetical protein